MTLNVDICALCAFTVRAHRTSHTHTTEQKEMHPSLHIFRNWHSLWHNICSTNLQTEAHKVVVRNAAGKYVRSDSAVEMVQTKIQKQITKKKQMIVHFDVC